MIKYPTDLSDNQWQFIKNTLQLDERAGESIIYDPFGMPSITWLKQDDIQGAS